MTEQLLHDLPLAAAEVDYFRIMPGWQAWKDTPTKDEFTGHLISCPSMRRRVRRIKTVSRFIIHSGRNLLGGGYFVESSDRYPPKRNSRQATRRLTGLFGQFFSCSAILANLPPHRRQTNVSHMMLRSFAESLTHGLIIRRQLPRPFSSVRMYVSSEAGLRYLKPRLDGVDPSLLRFAADHVHPGDVVWDIGANIGLFSMSAAAMAGATGHVVAIEADTWNVAMLRRSACAQQLSSAKIDVVPVAISNRNGFAHFRIAKRNRSTNSLDGFGSTQTGGVRERQTVPTVTLDSLLDYFPMPDLVKIDVEGAELLVLEGSTKVLDCHPVIHCEVTARNASRVRRLLTESGYTLFSADDPPPRMPVQDELPLNVLAMRIE